MTTYIKIIDKTGKQLVQDENPLEENPLNIISKKIELGELIVDNFTSTFNANTGICETTMYLRDTTPKINMQYYKHKSELLTQRIEKKKTKKSDKLNCHQCEHHNYDSFFGSYDEGEICEKGHELHPDECDDFKEV